MLVMRRRLKKPLIDRDWILSPFEMASWSGWWILTGLGELSCVGIFWLIAGHQPINGITGFMPSVVQAQKLGLTQKRILRKA